MAAREGLPESGLQTEGSAAAVSSMAARERLPESGLQTEGSAAVSSMVLFEDESVDVRYGTGAQLQLSPCGCEFTLLKPAERLRHPPRPAERLRHPPKPAERLRQRTRFTVSSYKEVLVSALAFRNKYARRPYLPEELIPAQHTKPCFSVDSDVRWPELSACAAELGPGGETIIRSEGGRAALMLSPSGEEFSVEFTCSLSQTASRYTDDENSPAQPKPETVYRSTSVVQHHSVCSVPSVWSYPLWLARQLHASRLWLARQLHASRLPEPEDVPADRDVNLPDISTVEQSSRLPEALPLTCSSPHWHRILNGTVPGVEVSPGDGSVLRSNGVLNTYFTHHRPDVPSGRVNEVTYHLDTLPPEVPGQLFSVGAVVRRASRILACFNETRRSLALPATPSCLELREGRHMSGPARKEEGLSRPVPVEQNVVDAVESRSDLVAAELEKIKRFNFLLENHHLLRNQTGSVRQEAVAADEETPGAVSERCVAEALQRTSRTIRDIDALISDCKEP
ncbi:uncharacterized protein C5orf34 homolog isoform X2 [Perca flavescens]|uniref:uncharacterized protein C5orf34 homolog isoform X2 n=1 Tax=Perca flavescens TaxID=8167 RepID=UPI00106EBCE7|nr:uncharacterized protein C5orf34 homolog isoform X2 [Perca flavescens]